MSTGELIGRIHEGMEVRSSDGTRIGKLNHFWIGTDPVTTHDRCDEEICSRLEVHHGEDRFYIPYNAIADVSGRVITLNVDAATVNEKGWYRKPSWIVQEGDSSLMVNEWLRPRQQ